MLNPQDIVYFQVDYDIFIVLIKILLLYVILMQPIQFFAPEIKKWIKEKSVKKKPFRGLH